MEEGEAAEELEGEMILSSGDPESLLREYLKSPA
jgi:hypothetical protein